MLALAALHHGVDLESEDALVPLATHLDVQFIAEGDLVKVILEGEDVSRELRKEETGMAASKSRHYLRYVKRCCAVNARLLVVLD